MRSLAFSTGIPQSTIHCLYRSEKIIRRVSDAIKPTLTEDNKFLCVMYAADRIERYNDRDGRLYYRDYDGEIHLDETWFFLTEVDQCTYLAINEEPTERHTRHKGHIQKVMFLCAVGCPKFNALGECIFDGKIDKRPFTIEEAAKTKQ